ncbi:MAG: hypothetical protein HY823_04925 [Acidobacteria bacterium]|nr:hypothetical protein [Acidobacteriota bacterium]
MTEKPRGGMVFQLFFLAVGLLFVGILVFVYLGARKANPELLDEKGRRIQAHRP